MHRNLTNISANRLGIWLLSHRLVFLFFPMAATLNFINKARRGSVCYRHYHDTDNLVAEYHGLVVDRPI